MRRRAAFATGTIVAALALVLSSCADEGSPAPSTGESPSGQEAVNTDFGALRLGNGLPSDAAGVLGAPAVGACASIEGKPEVARIVYGDCAKPEMTYRVAQIVSKTTGCVADINRRYYSSDGRGNQFTVCLNYNWSVDRCVFLGTRTVVSGGCDTTHEGRKLKTVGYFSQPVSVDNCPTGTGVMYAVQKVTVCQKDVK